MSGNISVKGTTYASVDTVYDGMDEGQRMHMANKLNKHGYVNPKLREEFPKTPQGNRFLAEELMDRMGGFHGAVRLLANILP